MTRKMSQLKIDISNLTFDASDVNCLDIILRTAQMIQYSVCTVCLSSIRLRIALKKLFVSDATSLGILLMLVEQVKGSFVECVQGSIGMSVGFWRGGMTIQKVLLSGILRKWKTLSVCTVEK